MKEKRRRAVLALLLLVSLALLGCREEPGPRQEAAEDSQQALGHFLEDLRDGDWEVALTYLEEGNPLRCVLSEEEPEVPELEEVFRTFRGRLGGLTFRLEPGSRYSDAILQVTAGQLDFALAIRRAMLEALEEQCRSGGGAFLDYAGWMARGVAAAEPGEEGTAHAVLTLSRGVYTVEHMGASDEEFLNLVTGGFYDYMDFQMAVCTRGEAGQDLTCLLAAQGDRIIAGLVEISQPLEEALSPEEEALLEEFYTQAFQALGERGVCSGAWVREGRSGVSTGIDFVDADQRALLQAGVVSGKYQGNTTAGYLSLRATLREMESEGWTCRVEPVYGREEPS